MYHSIFILLIFIIALSSSSQSNLGHLKPFGTVGSLINIDELHGEYPNILKLFTFHLPKAEPILSRQVLVNDMHYHIWKTDEQLENEIDGLSKTSVYTQSFTQPKRIQMKFGEFFDQYQKQQLFLVETVPEVFRKYLVVPRPLQCDAVLPILQSAILVINDIHASPLMLNEDYDFMLCLFRGSKRIVLVDTNKYPDVRQIVTTENRQSHAPPLNPDKVDLNQYPALANVEYHIANLTAGDCLFIPSNWVFQERSLDSTISIIYNIDHKQALNIDLNQVQSCSTSDTYDSSFTLDQIDWSTMGNEPQNFKEIIMSLVNSKSNNIEKWQETFSKHLSFDLGSDPETMAIFDELYGSIDLNGNGQVTIDEIESINGAHQHHISDVIYEMVKLVDDKQKNNDSSKGVKSKEDNVKETLENEDIDGDHHSENDKEDL